MDIETYLNAMVWSQNQYLLMNGILTKNDPSSPKRLRQYRAFRARILRMFEEKDFQINFMLAGFDVQTEQLAAKDARIVELEQLLSLVNDYRQGRLVADRKKIFELAKDLDV